jgi:hypothetical protein
MPVGQGNQRNQRGQPSQSKKEKTQPVPSAAIVSSSELDALRNYNAMMNMKLKERDTTEDVAQATF